ncbi:MAG: YceD family protein [Candidatus Methylomirabilaceae bacterium]
MLVERSRIPVEGLDLRLSEEPRWDGVEGLWTSLAAVEATFHLERKGEGVLARGAFNTTATLPCSRCSEPASVPVSDQFEVLYVASSRAPKGEEVELTAEEMDVNFLDDDRLDLSGLLRENVLLSLPVQPLCRAECRGLCPRCGVNMNDTSCQCHVPEPDPRLLPLRQLL